MTHVIELGRLDGPVLLFGGPYSNAQATQAVLDKGQGVQALICTGDVVAYCADPMDCVEMMQGAGVHVVAGNCERQLAARADTCGCGFDTGSTCDLLSAGWYAHADARVTDAARAWMAGLPDFITFSHQGRRVGVLHGGVQDIARFVWSVSSPDTFEAEWQALEARLGHVDMVIAGHSGIPFTRETARGLWVNAGVVGMPPHDGTAQTAYVMLEEGRVVHHRLSYDAQTAQARMVAEGLTQGYHAALTSGYWPSEDVLPLVLRRSAAVASG